MKLIDAYIAIYAHGAPHPYRESCRYIMDWLETEAADYAVDAETLQEILHVYSRRGETNRGIRIVENLLCLLPDIIPITTIEITATMRLLLATPGLSVRDAIHAAVVIGHGLDGMISADRDFDRIPGLRRYDPANLAAAQGAGG